MGAWGSGPFENEDAQDWALDLKDAAEEGTSFVEDYLQRVAHWPADDYLEAPEGSIALAAAEVVAALKGKAAGELPAEVSQWLQGRPAPDAGLVKLATAAVARTMTNSELADIWEDADPEEGQAWKAHCTSLQRRLGE